jgi:ubiquinone/menaquinone biosynthesis C-methylase UbiE
MNKHLEAANGYAAEYDKAGKERSWHGPEIIFGLMYEYLSPDEKLLDIGIGTGLDAAIFQLAGLTVYGVDGSAEMLKICSEKKVAVELKQLDLLKDDIPYPDKFFHHAIANALFHITGEIERTLHEVKRLLKAGGIFGFTTHEQEPESKSEYQETDIKGKYMMIIESYGFPVYKHTDGYVRDLLDKYAFELLKKTRYEAFTSYEDNPSYTLSLYITRKN